MSIESRLREWLAKISLERSNIIAISGLSRKFEDDAIAYVKGNIPLEPIHFFSYHLSLDRAASSVHTGPKAFKSFKDLVSSPRLIFLHGLEDVSQIRRFIGEIRSTLEVETKSTVVLIMRPATTYKVYQGTSTPFYGRVVKIEEPSFDELGIKNKDAVECGFFDLYKAYAHDGFDDEKATKSPESASFNVLKLFWHILINDSRKAGSVRLVSSCIASHDRPMTNSEINAKCGIEHGRQVIHAALKTGLMRMTGDRVKKSYIYPSLLSSWIKVNVPFYPA